MNKWKILSFVLFLTSTSLLFFVLNQKETFRSQFKSFVDGYSEMIDTFIFYKTNYEFFKLTGEKTNDVVCKHNNDSILLSKLINQKPILIFSFSDKTCNSCIDELLIYLQKFFFREYDKIMILSSHKNDMNYYMFLQSNNIRFPSFQISYDAFEWIHADFSEPFFFLLYPDMKISNIYVPNKAYPEMNKQYLEGIKRLLN